MTDEEWVRLDEDEEGELVDGILVEEEMPSFVHEIVVGWLMEIFRAWMRSRGGGVVGPSGAKFLLRTGRGRKPDAFVYLRGTRLPPRRGAARHPADILFEVVSPLPRDVRRDRVEKMDDYAKFGVRWYWLIDPEARTLEIYERDDRGRFARALGASAGKVDVVPGCEGLTFDLDALWGEIDALPEPEPGAEVDAERADDSDE